MEGVSMGHVVFPEAVTLGEDLQEGVRLGCAVMQGQPPAAEAGRGYHLDCLLHYVPGDLAGAIIWIIGYTGLDQLV